MWTAYRRCHAASLVKVVGAKIDVVGDEFVPRSDTDGAGRMVRSVWADIGTEIHPCPSADLGKAALGSVIETWHAEFASRPGGEALSRREGVIHGRAD